MSKKRYEQKFVAYFFEGHPVDCNIGYSLHYVVGDLFIARDELTTPIQHRRHSLSRP